VKFSHKFIMFEALLQVIS